MKLNIHRNEDMRECL